MDNNQNTSQSVNNMQQWYEQPQQGYVQQPQVQYDNMQQGYAQPQNDSSQINYEQPQIQYQNMQQGYAQQPYIQPQQNYDQSQMYYEQPQQMQYQQMNQQGYGQPMNYNQQIYPNQQQGYSGGMVPEKKLVINKKIIIIAASLVAVILAIIFIPKLFDKSNPPFKNIEFGLSVEEVQKEYDIDDSDAYTVDAYKHNVEGFGVSGSGQFCFYNDELNQVNWYVYEEDYEDDDKYEKAIDEAKKYYTDKYGKPERQEDYDDEWKYVWEVDEKNRIEVAEHDDFFTIRYVYLWYK